MINPDIIKRFSDDCKPRVLVVTDMWFSKVRNGFSLSQFIQTIVDAGAEVTKANLLPEGFDPEADLSEFTFDKLLRSRYDVCFIFAADLFSRSPLPPLSPEERTAIEKFMD